MYIGPAFCYTFSLFRIIAGGMGRGARVLPAARVVAFATDVITHDGLRTDVSKDDQ